jgi:hypothetical protein
MSRVKCDCVLESKKAGRWWLASLGVHALNGVSVFIRQDLVGGNYGLLADNFPWNVPLATDPMSMQVSDTTSGAHLHMFGVCQPIFAWLLEHIHTISLRYRVIASG